MKVLIVDDEILARKRIRNLLSLISEITVVEECSDGTSAIYQINEFKPDLVFMDIKLQDMSGFDILNKINTESKPYIIFVTAYDIYALQAFDFEAFDFILKPFKDDRFFKAVQKVLSLNKSKRINGFEERLSLLMEWYQSIEKNKGNSPQKLPVKIGNRTVLIDTINIKYISASGYYAEIHTNETMHLLRESLDSLNKILNKDHFYRIHRSTIININFVQEILHSDFAEIDVKMIDKKVFRVSKIQKKEFLKKIGI